MNERRKMLATNVVDTVILSVTTTDGSTNVGIEMVVTNGDTVYSVTTDSQGNVELTGLSGGCTIECETHEISVTEFYATGSMTIDISAYVNTFPVGEVRNYNYTASFQQVELIPGTYKLQCWGAQGGSCSDGYSGGNGGYSEGVLSLTTPTNIYIYVGGQGGWNGGGQSTGSSDYDSDGIYGRSTMGNGGGATDIRAGGHGTLYDRMIVAGGGSGGAYGYQKVTTTETSWEDLGTFYTDSTWINSAGTRTYASDCLGVIQAGEIYRVTVYDGDDIYELRYDYSQNGNADAYDIGEFTAMHSDLKGVALRGTDTAEPTIFPYFTLEHEISSSSTTTDSDYQYGHVGGGVNGGGYDSDYYGKQNAAGNRGLFGQGAPQDVSNYRYCSGAGGGGWYGGGSSYSDDDLYTIKMSGGGSGFVNTAANAQYRPSGYMGLELDSGTTYDGNERFPAVDGGVEYGHRGNGYARITRIT